MEILKNKMGCAGDPAFEALNEANIIDADALGEEGDDTQGKSDATPLVNDNTSI